MPTILVPIDFTAASENALVYANKLALRLPADIVLVHGGPAPGLAAPAPDRLRRLQALAERLRYQHLSRQSGRRISYQFRLTTEPLPAALPGLVADTGARLVVLGLTLTDCAATTATGAALPLLPEQVGCPVLVVPAGRHELPDRVVVSGSFAQLDPAQLDHLAVLARTPRAQFQLVQFHAPTHQGLVPLKKALLEAKAHLPGAAVHLLPEEDTLEDLSEFCAQHSAQLLVLATPDGCLRRRFFNPIYTKTNAYHLRIPVLLLPAGPAPAPGTCCAQCGLRQAARLRSAASVVRA